MRKKFKFDLQKFSEKDIEYLKNEPLDFLSEIYVKQNKIIEIINKKPPATPVVLLLRSKGPFSLAAPQGRLWFTTCNYY
jgi:hypothetical protein